jgi:hypothetical protein
VFATGLHRNLASAIVAVSCLGAAAIGPSAAEAGNGANRGEQVTKVTVKGAVGTARTVTTACPRGQTAISGGWRTGNVGRPDDGALNVYESLRVGVRSWRVSARIALAAGSHSFQVTANCLRAGPSVAVSRTERVTPASTQSPGGRTTKARCPRGTRAVAGGFRLSSGAAASVTGFYRAGRATSWRTEVSGLYDSRGAARLTTIAYCGPRRPPVVLASRLVSSNDTYTLAGLVTRPCQKAPLSTGFRSEPTDPNPFDDAQIATSLGRRGTAGSVGIFYVGPYATDTRIFAYCR